MIAAKAPPIARASAADSVLPTMPRISYSRRTVGSKRWPTARLLAVGFPEIGAQQRAQPLAEIGVPEPERDRRLEIAELVAAIEALAAKAQPMEGLALLDQQLQRVGQLDLAAAAFFGAVEMGEHFGLNDVAADDRQVGRRVRRLRLFDDALRLDEAAVFGNDVEHAIALRVLARHLHDRDEV